MHTIGVHGSPARGGQCDSHLRLPPFTAVDYAPPLQIQAIRKKRRVCTKLIHTDKLRPEQISLNLLLVQTP
jgi:hypothetical protein